MLLAACATSPASKTSQTPVMTQDGAVVNYSMPANLKPTHILGCVSVANASDTWTPAEVFPAMRACIDRGDYPDAVGLFTLATSYGRFDMMRVADRSAWNAISVLQLQYLKGLSPAQKAAFDQAAQAMLQNRGQICSELETLGPPEYMPTYMLEHGMAAFTRSLKNGGLVENFNAQSAWGNVLREYVHCG
ncbi:MAG: hypothetical protein KGL13_05540 [Gammaproteobacteria bacterium]|nr:hypothetical protein [Gammaproteobacteria bacterium]MDE2345912.1 hypothetical protein [Gammaproteobacteria bacterium]